MKKAILSPLSSALIIPGLGQIINQSLRKGICILLGVFILLVAGIIKLYHMISVIFRGTDISQLNSATIMDRLKTEGLSSLWYLAAAFSALWIYSVLDGYLTGKKIDQEEEKDRL